MTFKEKLDSLRARAKTHITPESSEEEIKAYNDILKDIDDIEKEHNDIVEVNSKYKDTIVNMVLNQGDGKTPVDEIEGAKPKGLDGLLAEFQEKENKKENK